MMKTDALGILWGYFYIGLQHLGMMWCPGLALEVHTPASILTRRHKDAMLEQIEQMLKEAAGEAK
jgi:hypothetical protein